MKAGSFVLFSIENLEKLITCYFPFICKASNRKLLWKHAFRRHNTSKARGSLSYIRRRGRGSYNRKSIFVYK